MTPPPPFVLLDDARDADAGPARLYEGATATIVATTPAEVEPALARLRAAVAGGAHAAGYLAYEAGHALEPKLASLRPEPVEELPFSLREERTVLRQARHEREGRASPLLWFGLFPPPRLLAPAHVAAWLPDPAGASATAPVPQIERAAYDAAVARILAYIAAGDIYQANLTFPATVRVCGDPRALYAALRAARAGWGGIVWTGDAWLLSASPELFFTLTDTTLAARPMKGTAPHASDPAALAADPKQRAENLMIVDLIRNDLSRVAVPGSVRVPHLFTVETYPTLHQLTSTVTATLAPGRDAVDVLAATFPCGSVTGAPKLRAQEIVAEVEATPRGPYTGSIGWLDPAGNAAFNVAIRTLALRQGDDHATLGLGSAIVADSDAGSEWRECLAKGRFVSAAAPRFDLIETMRFDPHEGIADLDRHLARMTASADALGFAFDRHDARNELQAATFRLRSAARLRLMLAHGGAVAIEATEPPPTPAAPAPVRIVPLPVPPTDIRLHHKTSDRAFYDDARHAAGTFEVIFADADGFLTEGSFTTLFVERDGRLLTPPATRGLLPGILRRRLIDEGRAVEADLRAGDLAGGFLIGNALRGLLPARLATWGE